MNRPHWSRLALLATVCIIFAPLLRADGETQPARDPKQPVDEAYTAKMKKYTTEPFFTSPLVNYLPASKSVPTPKAVLGDIAGASLVYGRMREAIELAPRTGAERGGAVVAGTGINAV